jgi:hypothetical protein
MKARPQFPHDLVLEQMLEGNYQGVDDLFDTTPVTYELHGELAALMTDNLVIVVSSGISEME